MKILVTGVAGQLGHDVCLRLDKLGIENRGVDIADFDLTDAQAVSTYIKEYAPDAIIHCAAYTNVDKAEDEPELCARVNADGTANMARAAKEIGAKMIAVSTDYVLAGEGDEPLDTDAKYNPQSVYGETKMRGEIAAREILDRLFIVRIAWAFGVNGKNFVRTMLRLGAEKDEIGVVCDQFGSPTYTEDLAVLLCDMIRTEKYGTYHATNEGFISWADFAQAIMREAGLNCRVNPITSDQYPSKAKRPANSRLSKECLDRAGFSRLPAWQDALQRYIGVLRERGEL